MARRRRQVGKRKSKSLKRLLRKLAATKKTRTGSRRSTKNLRRQRRRRRSRATPTLNRRLMYAKRMLNLRRNLERVSKMVVSRRRRRLPRNKLSDGTSSIQSRRLPRACNLTSENRARFKKSPNIEN